MASMFAMHPPIQVGNETWWLVTSLPSQEYFASITSVERTSNVFSVLTVLVAIVLIIVILKRMLKPLEETEGAATAMAGGFLHVNVTYESGDEQVAAAAQDLSQGSTEQAATVQDLSRSMEQISNETKHTAQMAEQANSISGLMGDEVVRSKQKMQEMSEAMKDITSKSNEIEKIIKTIDDIAFQTNILALNAAVEAVRAGFAGKGFAVVVDEVRNLAQKSAEAAKNTMALIEGTIRSVANGGRLTEETAGALQEVAENVERVTKLIHEISVASAEQSESIISTTNGIEQISAVIQTNSATAEECAETSEELSSQVSIMNGLVSRFKLKEN